MSTHNHAHLQGWPEPYIHVVYGREFDKIPAKNAVYILYIYVVMANPTHLSLICLFATHIAERVQVSKPVTNTGAVYSVSF